MKKIFPIIILLITILIIAIVLYADKGNGASKSNIVSIEDSIIIHDLKMDSDEPLKNVVPESFDGSIIFDNSFEDTIIDYDKIHAPVVKEKKTEDVIKRLRKKSRRWHLTRYKIRKRDNLWKIAKRFRVSHKLIIEANNIKRPGHLRPGKYIVVPNKRGIYYRVRSGDTVSKIAYKYKASTKKILAHNNLRAKYLQKGKKIFIPDAKKRYRKKYKRSRRLRYARRKGIRIIWPLRGKITSSFGSRRDPLNGKRSFHSGIDISVVLGTPVRAAAGGRVIFSGWKPGYGRIVIVKHRRGYITVYAHNWKNLVRVNQRVKRGQRIALSGNTGRTTGAHLHFELRKYLTPLNPLRFL